MVFYTIMPVCRVGEAEKERVGGVSVREEVPFFVYASVSQAADEGNDGSATVKSNLMVADGNAITIDGRLENANVSVGIVNSGEIKQQATTEKEDLQLLPGTFTTGFAQNNPAIDPRSVFTSDSSDYHVFFTAGEKEAQLAVPRKIECAQTKNGKVETKDEAAAGEIVKLAVTADTGYELDTLTVVGKTSGKPVAVSTDNVFTMPDEDVTVLATFKPLPLEVPTANVTAHVQRTGWLPQTTAAGAIAGTTGQSRRLEALKLTLSGASVMTSAEKVSGGIEYRAHLQRKGWETDWVRDDAQCGTTGQSRRLEAVQIRLYGDMEKKFDVYYRVHVQRIGWMGWAKNGQEAGTQGMSRRAEAVQVVLVEKDTAAPDATYNGAAQQYAKAFVKK